MTGAPSIIERLQEGEVLENRAEVDFVTRQLFLPRRELPEHVDLCVVLGSGRCEYRVQAALEQCGTGPHRFVLSGGGVDRSNRREADRMKAYLLERGVVAERIWSESISQHTRANLEEVESLLVGRGLAKSKLTIALFTGGFHLRRTAALLREVWSARSAWRVVYGAAYGPRTRPDNWHDTEAGRKIIGHELARLELIPAANG